LIHWLTKCVATVGIFYQWYSLEGDGVPDEQSHLACKAKIGIQAKINPKT
jgi:hypothetical protein